ncbi:hypothetical protein CPB86DRAFT_784572 [Serendipita vermifera]|nr:hypothetical protein CPB86DRAFT_784572 [Serendipita vermifera]
MPSLFKTVVAALAVAATPALAELSVTAPIASTKCTGGQTCQVSWNDNGRGVTLAQQGNMTIALYTGGAQQQVSLLVLLLAFLLYRGSFSILPSDYPIFFLNGCTRGHLP